MDLPAPDEPTLDSPGNAASLFAHVANTFQFNDRHRSLSGGTGHLARFNVGVTAHRDQVDRGSRFKQLTDGERDEIVRRARRLAGSRRLRTTSADRANHGPEAH